MIRSCAVMTTLMIVALSSPCVAFPTDTLLAGYSRTLVGSVIEYSSSQPDANSALLVRSLDSANAMEWETVPLPASFAGDSATFVWLFGLNGNLETRPFHMFVNGSYLLTFQRLENTAATTWSAVASDGSALRFRRTLVDKNNDYFGYAFLTVPASRLTPGMPLRIRVQGESVGSRTWYMTFQHRLRDTIIVSPQDALLRDGSAGAQPIYVDITRLLQAGNVTVQPPHGEKVSSRLQFGFNRIIVKVPGVEKARQDTLHVILDAAKSQDLSYLQKPVRRWTVYMVQHAHTDIGYTRAQTEILPEHMRYIDYALDYCDQTDSLPDDARFRWTCEASWPVARYVQCRPPEQVSRLIKRIKEGRIEVTAMMFNMSELPDENQYVTFLKPLEHFKNLGIPVRTAMQDDVTGAAWCLVDDFHDLGIHYLTMGINPDRALRPFDVPTSFWWESPSGNRLLVYRSDHYMTGNFMGIEQGRLAIVEPAMFAYLQGMEQHHYPFDRIAVQYSGYYTDNSPPSTAGCRVIEAWNEKYLWPHLRNATDGEFPAYVEHEHASTLPRIRAAWPDWWTDGTASAPRETAAARQTQADMIVNEGLMAMARLSGAGLPSNAAQENDGINDQLLFYDEHTFGSAESISDPLVQNSEVQWSEKRAYVWDAVKRSAILRECGLGLLQQKAPQLSLPSIAVYNTLSWKRSGRVVAYIDNQILPPDHRFALQDSAGHDIMVQPLSRRADGTYWAIWAENVPALGFTTYVIDTSKGHVHGSATTPILSTSTYTMEDRYYNIAVDLAKGGITSVYDLRSKTELIDSTSQWAAGQIIRETLTDREQLQQYKLVGYKRSTLSNVRFENLVTGPIWTSLSFSGESEGCYGPHGVVVEVRIYHEEPRIELLVTAMKRPITDPESYYVAFPFAMPHATLCYDAQGGVVVPGVTQISGSASDWQTVQNFAAVRSNASQIVLGSDACPLFQFGDINTGKFQRVAHVERPFIFAWPMNNYWTTNFVAEEDGELRWEYYLTSSSDTSLAFATEFGWASRIPMVARVLPAGAGSGHRCTTSLLGALPRNILLVSARPSTDDTGVILQLREVEGKPTDVPLATLRGTSHVQSFATVNALGEREGPLEEKAVFRGYETKFLEMRIGR